MAPNHSAGRFDARINRIAALVLLSFSFAYGLAGSRIAYSFSSDPLGPRAFPVLLSATLAVLSLIYLLVPGKGEMWPSRAVLLRCVLIPGLVLMAALILEPLGFAVSMFVLTAGTASVFGASWKASVIAGVAQAAMWYFVFGFLLEVYLPTGSLFGSLGRG